MSDYLPHEVVRDILLSLPVKSLIRFRCVSKSCNSLITSSDFIDSHLTRSHSLPSSSNSNNTLIFRDLASKPNVEKYRLIHNDSFDRIEHLEFPLTTRPRSRIYKCTFIGYVNGLFCLYEKKRFILSNPSIRKCIILPKHCIKIKTDGHVKCHSAFGFDPRTNDYKVVIIALPYNPYYMKKQPTLVEVYSLSEGSWKMIDASTSFPPNIRFDEYKCPAASLNGAIHFTVKVMPNFTELAILSFDLRDAVFHVISLAASTSRHGCINASVFRGLLSLICQRSTPSKCCDIWVMKEYGVVDSWTKQFTFDRSGGYLSVIGLRKNGHVLMNNMESMLQKGPRVIEEGNIELDLLPSYTLSSYDPESQQFKNLGSIGKALQCVDNYNENLVLLRKPNDAVSRKGVSRKRKCR
ncbi:F-box protein CPR1 isoform X1 [Quercus suber]|uniref:F-box protein CPR1 isoform X1 n=1 Tax=Quercus suber TaxID=58331 RepID=UPI000CE22F50|nr:F-box protein CPR1-like [Quercus suber]